MTDEESLIKQQIEYYRARTPEYDEWFLRKGRYDRGITNRKQWFAEIGSIRKALKSTNPKGSILELACGTGLWTEYLVSRATNLVAVDVSSEAIEANRRRIADERVSYVVADLFSWKPTDHFDYVFFGFWLSHVPRSRFDGFWNLVADALNPDGQVFFVDSLYTTQSTARDHPKIDRNGRALRRLNDGREFEIVKIFYEPPELERILADRGWTGYIRPTDNFFLYGNIRKKN